MDSDIIRKDNYEYHAHNTLLAVLIKPKNNVPVAKDCNYYYYYEGRREKGEGEYQDCEKYYVVFNLPFSSLNRWLLFSLINAHDG